MKELMKLHNLDDIQTQCIDEVLHTWNPGDDFTNQHVWRIRTFAQKLKSTMSPTAIAQIIASSFILDKSTTVRTVREWVDKVIRTKRKMRSTKQKQTLQNFMSSILVHQPRLFTSASVIEPDKSVNSDKIVPANKGMIELYFLRCTSMLRPTHGGNFQKWYILSI